MISVYEYLWLGVADYAAKYQSGTSVDDTFNRNLKQSQLEIIADLSPYYQSNEKIKNILDSWVRREYDQSDEYGVILLPGRETVNEETGETFLRALALGVTDSSGTILYEMHSVQENEIFTIQRVPQRSPSIAKKRVYWLNYDNRIQLYPSEAIYFSMFYLIYPLEARIAFRTLEDPDTGEFYQEYFPEESIDLQWDEIVAPLFLAKMLEKYGYQNRETVVAEYGKLLASEGVPS